VVGGCQSASTCEVVAVKGETLWDDAYPIPDQATATTILLSTRDGGVQWTARDASAHGYAPLEASCGGPTQCGILVLRGDGRQYLDATDTGSSWTLTSDLAPVSPWLIPLNLLGGAAAPISCTRGGFCMLASLLPSKKIAEYVYASSDGGVRFTKVRSPKAAIFIPLALSCPGPRVCALLYEDQGDQRTYFSETADGGAVWSARVLASAAAESVALACTSARFCVTVAEGFNKTDVRTTTTGGQTWTGGHWAGPVGSTKDDGVALLGPMSCTGSVCMTFDESGLINPVGAWDDLDRAAI
jgi:hypothetical protein